MTTYRQNALSLPEHPRRHVFMWFEHNERNPELCPSCRGSVEHSPYHEPWREVICTPFRRVVVAGWLFWRRYCPIDGFHWHYRCPNCKARWIVRRATQPEMHEIL